MKRRTVFLVSVIGAISLTDSISLFPWGWSQLPEFTERLIAAAVIASVITIVGPRAFKTFLAQRLGRIESQTNE